MFAIPLPIVESTFPTDDNTAPTTIFITDPTELANLETAVTASLNILPTTPDIDEAVEVMKFMAL